jgi:hypothetical protein
MNEKKFRYLVDEIEEFIGEHERSNSHYLSDETIIEVFAQYKKKHIKQAIKELR